MPAFSGSFHGMVRGESTVNAAVQPGHMLGLAAISGTQTTEDRNWNGVPMTYWGISDMVGGGGTQHGYFSDDHGAAGRDFGTFEGKISMVNGQPTVEGTWEYTGGTGDFSNLSGGGTFTTRMTSPTDVEATWEGAYELGAAKARSA